MGKIHKVKIEPKHFDYVLYGLKPFEIRENDNNYQQNDVVIFREFDETTGKYTGRFTSKYISYILKGHIGMENNHCILGLLSMKLD